MNKSNIEWTDFTINPVRTFCRHKCPYCYARRMAEKKRPAHLDVLKEYRDTQISWHAEVLTEVETRKKPGVFFVGSMTDLFGEWVPESYIHWIIDTAKNCPQHTFLFLTKNPKRYTDFDFPDNCWTGATVTNMESWYPTTKRSFVSLEPLMMQLPAAAVPMIIGAMTGPGAVKPKKEWVEHILKYAQQPIFLKNNLLDLFPGLPKLRDLPWRKTN